MGFYKYIIYRLYSARKELNDEIPATRTEINLCIIHFIQLMILYAVATLFFPSIHTLIQVNKFQVAGVLIIFYVLYHFLIFKKIKWDRYLEEFKYETPEERKRKGVWVELFTTGSIVLFFTILILSIIVR